MSPSTTSDSAFRFGLGHPVLELLATRAGRRTEPRERLAAPEDLTRWLELSGLAHGARCDQELLAHAHELREAIYRTVIAARDQRRPGLGDVQLVNSWASKPTPSPQLDTAMRVTFAGPEPCEAALATLARTAIELVAGPALARVRSCASPSCSLMFIDHSRPGRRRWCSMERCGNRAKTSHYRQRRRQSN
jgi:predicted RNA-binding Zn ribbon-like protein